MPRKIVPMRPLSILGGAALLMTAGACLCAGSGFARAETLEQAVATALNNHPSVIAALAGRDIAQAERAEQRAGYFPEVNVNLATGRVYGDNSTSRGLTVDRGSGYSWSHEGGVTVRQMLFDGMETSNRVDAASARRDSAENMVMDVRETLAMRTAITYLEILRNRAALDMIRGHAKKVADYRARIKRMVDEGAADESMAVQAHDVQNQLDATLADIDGQLKQALADYMEITGHAGDDPMARPSIASDMIPADVEQAVSGARQAHPAVIAARLQGQAAQHEIAAERGTLYPDITGEMSMYKKDLDDIIGGEVVDERALIRMNWTFSTGGAQIEKIRQSQHRQTEAEARGNELTGQLEREIRKAYAELGAAQDRLRVSRDRTKVNKDLVGAYEKQFELAKVTILNLLQVENGLFNAALGEMNADYRVQAAQYTVLANMGQLQNALQIKPAKE